MVMAGCPCNLGDMGVNAHQIPPAKCYIVQKESKRIKDYFVFTLGRKEDKHLLCLFWKVLDGNRYILQVPVE